MLNNGKSSFFYYFSGSTNALQWNFGWWNLNEEWKAEKEKLITATTKYISGIKMHSFFDYGNTSEVLFTTFSSLY